MHPRRRHPAGSPFHFRVAVMTDYHHVVVIGMKFFYHPVDTANQWTGGIYGAQAKLPGTLFHLYGYAMGTEDTDATGRNIVKMFDENRPAPFEFGNHMTVMDDLVQDVNRSAEPCQAEFDRFDRPLHPGTKPPRCRQ